MVPKSFQIRNLTIRPAAVLAPGGWLRLNSEKAFGWPILAGFARVGLPFASLFFGFAGPFYKAVRVSPKQKLEPTYLCCPEKHCGRNAESPAQLLNVGFVERPLLVQDF